MPLRDGENFLSLPVACFLDVITQNENRRERRLEMTLFLYNDTATTGNVMPRHNSLDFGIDIAYTKKRLRNEQQAMGGISHGEALE